MMIRSATAHAGFIYIDKNKIDSYAGLHVISARILRNWRTMRSNSDSLVEKVVCGRVRVQRTCLVATNVVLSLLNEIQKMKQVRFVSERTLCYTRMLVKYHQIIFCLSNAIHGIGQI